MKHIGLTSYMEVKLQGHPYILQDSPNFPWIRISYSCDLEINDPESNIHERVSEWRKMVMCADSLTLCHTSSLSLQQVLWQLLTSLSSLSTFTVHAPRIYIYISLVTSITNLWYSCCDSCNNEEERKNKKQNKETHGFRWLVGQHRCFHYI